MIDPNFLRYAIESKRRKIETATVEELPQLISDSNELLTLLAEGDRNQRDLNIKNQEWLCRAIAA